MDNNNVQKNNVEKYRVDGMSLKGKADKIASAIHMVTDCIEDNEPIRFKLRSLAIELASSAHALLYTPARDRGYVFGELEIVATEIMSFITIAKNSRIISAMNADILLHELTANTERMRAWTETGFYESENDRSGDRVEFTLNDSHFKTGSHSQIASPSETPVQDKKTASDQRPHQVSIYKPGTDETQKDKKPDQSDTRKFDFAMKLSRRNSILKIIKDKHEVTIKDISTVIADCSEKTIQRELIALVSEGVLKRVGEKRWSKYMLA